MCGRFTQTLPFNTLRERFGAQAARAELPPAYNVAPTDPVAVVLPQDGRRVLDVFRWGLIPAWSRALKGAPRPFNARAEGLATSGMFKRLASRRCLVLADGFFEWAGPKERRQPLRATLVDGAPFAFAGLWDCWSDPAAPGAAPLHTCTVITVAPNALLAPIHDRMPAILSPADEARWLDSTLTLWPQLMPLLRPYPAEAMKLQAVSSRVNDVRNRGPECIAPAA